MLFQIKNKIIANTVDKIKTRFQEILTLPGSTNKIAQGVALGVAFDFLPIPIISIPLSYLAARLLRCNPVAAVATVIFFKLAVPFFYTLDALTGKLLGGSFSGPTVEFASDNVIIEYIEKILEMGYPFLLGSIINAVIIYFIVFYILRRWISEKKARKRITGEGT